VATNAAGPNQYQQAIENYRSTLKWVLATFGAIGGALIVGLQLTGLGSLHGERLDWALVCAGVALLALSFVVVLAAHALSPVSGTYADWANSETFAKLRRQAPWVTRPGASPSVLLRGRAENLKDLVDKRNSADGEERAQLNTLMSDLTNLGLMLRVRQLTARTLVAVGLAAPLVAAAAIAYAYLSNPPDPTKAVDCISYYAKLQTLASGSPGLVAALQHTNSAPLPIVIDAQSRACGVHDNAELARLLSLSH
jgi:hypothetical protein